MMGIKAVIRMTKFDEVKDALKEIGIEYFTYYDVRGVSFQAEQKGIYRGSSIMDSTSAQKRVLDLVVPDIEAQDVIDCINKSATTGSAGDGKIYIYPVTSVIRIGT